jgi:hemoglobin
VPDREPLPLHTVPTSASPSTSPRDAPTPAAGAPGRAAEPAGPTARAGRDAAPQSFYELVGGEATFRRLVARFYELVATDDLLRPMYPEEDLGPAEDRLRTFLEQYWGGPTTYSDQRGHPRLRMRHAPYRVGPVARDRWLQHMRTALGELGLAPLPHATLWDYLERAAHAMVNTFDEGA